MENESVFHGLDLVTGGRIDGNVEGGSNMTGTDCV